MRALIAIALLTLASCAAKGMESAPDAGTAADAGMEIEGRDGGPDSGTVAPGVDAGEVLAGCNLTMCVPASDILELSLESVSAQSATAVWNGEELIVAYWDPESGGALGEIVVQAIDLDGNVRWRETTPGTNVPALAWNREAGAGFVFADAYASWLDSDGVVGASGRSAPPGSSQTYATTAAIRGGFLTVSGWSNDSMVPLHVSTHGPSPGAVTWTEAAPSALRGTSAIALDEAGYARWLVSGREIYEVSDDGSLGAPIALAAGPRLENARGLVALGDRFVSVFDHYDGQTDHGVDLLVWSRSGALLGSARIGDANQGPSASLARLDGDVVLAGSYLTDGRGAVQLASVNADAPSLGHRIDVTGPRFDESHVRHEAHVVRTSRGLAVVWTENPNVGAYYPFAQMRLYDCCL